MSEQFVLSLVYNCFALTDGDVEFLCKRFKRYAVNEPPFEHPPVPFGVDMLINQFPHFAVCVSHDAPRS